VTLTHILILSIIGLIAGWFIPKTWRIGFLLSTSILSIYWLQLSSPIRHLDFWLPTTSIILTIFVWNITQKQRAQNKKTIFITTAGITGIIILIGITRYINSLCCITASRPPAIQQIIVLFSLGLIFASLPVILPQKRFWATFGIFFFFILFIFQKSPVLALNSSAFLRTLTGQNPELALPIDLTWLGFSYLSFRLIHVLRDFQIGKLPTYTLAEFVTYALFFPTFTAGPIDRSQRFMGDLSKKNLDDDQQTTEKKNNLIAGTQRTIIGIFKKFVLADTLALFALNEQNASQVSSSFWMWILLLGYTFRIYLDFSGYTDIAIGIGRLMDFRLPENFNRPYFKKNLTEFWNSWHITLAQWLRAYYFFPITRFFRMSAKSMPVWSIIFIGQLSTMAFIGLWHGITWNFLIWGIWHGIGLFIHNRWQDLTKTKTFLINQTNFQKQLLTFTSWLLTFGFVTLGWVWFALPDFELSNRVIHILFQIK
jgi:alginate O-acetyltransferase complex protein AlgI